jgi:hypothetical protein
MLTLPPEANAILIIDPDAVLAPPFTTQALKTIPQRHGQLAHGANSIDLI